MTVTKLPTTTLDHEPEGQAEDAHEHGIVLHQLEEHPVPLVAEDAEDDAVPVAPVRPKA